MSTKSVRAGQHTVEIHRPDKKLFPDDGLTKEDVVGYYRSIAPFMVPHLKDRPLMLERHPDGIGGLRFMQKQTPDSYPEWIHRVEVDKADGTVVHPVCDSTATLLFLADQATLTFHRWQSKVKQLERPDRMVFDLDPAEDDFEAVRRAARQLGELLDELRLPSALMTTGSRGLHVIVPLAGDADFDETRAFAHDVAEKLAERDPERLTTAVRKKAREGRLYLDVQRNAYAQTAVAPYSIRAKPGAPVATPITWEQLKDPELTARRWTVTDALEQARTKPWEGVLSRGRSLAAARRRLDSLG
ncbi:MULTISPECIES: non-homologous end-joining DNA ligase [unclassified Streptomyces]|uniref:non-homologous end-joining DNA ligase n=1 Tax=unclassified Streptomyces TaxID=2593676 RepID=UPI00331C9E3F